MTNLTDLSNGATFMEVVRKLDDGYNGDFNYLTMLEIVSLVRRLRGSTDAAISLVNAHHGEGRHGGESEEKSCKVCHSAVRAIYERCMADLERMKME